MTSFAQLNLKSEILENLESLGYHTMTPVQEKSLGLILARKDILAQANTGSGKTIAFALGVLSQIDSSQKNVQALVICPTRELAEQVAKEIRKLARLMGNVKVVSLCGGLPFGPQAASLEHGAHCIVGTPGRLEDHLGRKTLYLKKLKTLVLDEADRILDMGFSDSLDFIVSCLPQENRQTLLFSATYPENIKNLSQKYQKSAQIIKVESQAQPLKIEEIFFKTEDDNKFFVLKSLLSSKKPESTIIFCETKQGCHDLAEGLKKEGFSALAIHGDLDQYERTDVLTLFTQKSLSILVATDVAARGLDVKDLTAVVNYNLARDPEVHVHRIGRTGRAGQSGFAWNLCTRKDKNRITNIEAYQKIEVKLIEPNYKEKSSGSYEAPMVSFSISGGRKNKVRPTDVLGALTASKVLSSNDVGKIDIFDFHTFVARKKERASFAYKILTEEKIKGRFFKVRKVTL